MTEKLNANNKRTMIQSAQLFLQNKSQDEEDEDLMASPRTPRHDRLEMNQMRFSLSEESLRPMIIQTVVPLKEKIHHTLEDPSYSLRATLWSAFTLLLVLLGTITFLIMSYPQYQQVPLPDWIFALEICMNLIFTGEWIARAVTADRKIDWFFSPLTIVDLVAFLPFWIDLAFEFGFIFLSFLRILRIFRFLRVFRIARWARFSPMFLVMHETVRRSKPAFVLLVFLVLIAVIIYSSVVFYAEQIPCDLVDGVWYRPDGSISPYQSIPETFWWCIVTLTGVGYGDAVPITWYGRFVAGVAMLSGVMTLAFPISLVGAEFSRVWATFQRKEREMLAAEKAKEESPMNLESALQLLKSTCDGMNQEIAAIRAKQDDLQRLIAVFESHLHEEKTGSKFSIGDPDASEDHPRHGM
eukprot:TRINITY_DN7705_c0_g1_i1.p1 TRINITY_DN7705_c0_g1~~TRINITY_DN7705_c0_g1_i1.p1  ORF type:complete len:411 (+),score=80.25 TRINITY_DN7705_c0_g1_i1:732-1964(+)